MFKTKWQKKYETIMSKVKFWSDFHEKESLFHEPDSELYAIHCAQRDALNNVLNDMRRLAGS